MSGTIVHIGNFRVDYTTESHRARSLEEHGYEVVRMQENEITNPATILATARRTGASLVLYTETHGWGLDPGTTSVWRDCEKEGIATASVHLDLFFGIRRSVAPHDPLFTTGTVFTPDGDHDQDWRNLGINHRYLRAGVLRAECAVEPALPMRTDGVDVIFVGSDDGYHAEWPHRRVLMQHLRDRYGDRFRKYGGKEGPTVRGAELNVLYQQTPIVVGDTLTQAEADSTFWSDRVYETWGRGGFLLHPYVEKLWAEFDPIVPPGWAFGDFDRLDALIDAFLADPQHRLAFRDAMATHVREHCTYTHRSAEMLRELGLPYNERFLP